MIPYPIIEELTKRVSRSVERVLGNIRERQVMQEPPMTDRLLANIERDFEQRDNDVIAGVKIQARTLSDRGANSAESRYGADMATLLEADINDYHIKKGFLAQAKWEPHPVLTINRTYQTERSEGRYIVAEITPDTVDMPKTGTIRITNNAREHRSIKDQCSAMLEITPDSFVFVYTPEDIFVVPASAVASSARGAYLYCKNLKTFMTDYLTSFIGDTRIKGIWDDDLDELRAEYQAKSILLFKVSEA